MKIVICWNLFFNVENNVNILINHNTKQCLRFILVVFYIYLKLPLKNYSYLENKGRYYEL